MFSTCSFCGEKITNLNDTFKLDGKGIFSPIEYYHLTCACKAGVLKCFYCQEKITENEKIFKHDINKYYHEKCIKKQETRQKIDIAKNNKGIIHILDHSMIRKIAGKEISTKFLEMGYVSNIEIIDEKIDSGNSFKRELIGVNNDSKHKPRLPAFLRKCWHGYKLEFVFGLSNKYYIVIPYENINKIILEDVEQRYYEKEKSIVGRGIIGGLLLGPLGAAIGGASGLGNEYEKIEHDKPDTLIGFTVNPIKVWNSATNDYLVKKRVQTQLEKTIIFSCTLKEKSTASYIFTKDFPDKFIKTIGTS